MWLLFYCILASDTSRLPYPLILEADESVEAPGEQFMTRPAAALYRDGVLYIADITANKVFILEKDKLPRTIGRKGHGPQEMRNHPVHLGFDDDGLLVVGTWNLWETLYMDPKTGVVKRKVKRKREDRSDFFGGLTQTISYEEILRSGYAYRLIDSDCRIGRMPTKDDLGQHQAMGFVMKAEDGSIVHVARAGSVEVVGDGCARLGAMKLPVALLSEEPEPHKLSTSIRKKILKMDGTAYVGGHPVMAAAARDKHTVWALADNEVKWWARGKGPLRTAGVHPDYNATLIAVDPIAGKLIFSVELDGYFDNVDYYGGYLILTSTEEARVQVYRVSE
ncbi:MAG: hypothetical protein QNK37_04725 [Acidobacteriota bacterium]|nr:hypothetical protein [Acidobacteriota bacterium]